MTEITDELQKLVLKYNWSHSTYGLLTRKIHKGSRSHTLTHMAFNCIEMGMADEEIYIVLNYMNNNCKKFRSKRTKEKKLLSIIEHAKKVKNMDMHVVIFWAEDKMAQPEFCTTGDLERTKEIVEELYYFCNLEWTDGKSFSVTNIPNTKNNIAIHSIPYRA